MNSLRSLLLVGQGVLLANAACSSADGDVVRLASDVVVDAPEILASDSVLHDILDMTVDSIGRVWILSGFDPFILVLDSAAGTTTRIGRRGQGPGELRLPWYYVDHEGGGTPTVLDVGNWKLVRLGLDGDVEGELRLQQRLGIVLGSYRSTQFGRPLRVEELDGQLIGQAFTDVLGNSADLWSGVLVRLDSTGALADTIIHFSDLARDAEEDEFSVFGPGPLWTTCEARTVAVLNPETQVLLRHDIQEGRLEDWKLDLPAVPILSVDVERHIAHGIDLELRERGGPDARSPEILQFMRSIVSRVLASAPELAPPVGLECDDMGRVWVQLFSTGHDPRGLGPQWLVTDGTNSTVVEFPEHFHPVRIYGDWALGYTLSEVGVQLPARVRFADSLRN